MVAKDRQRTPGSTKLVEVGEIDTRAPFQSVKDAVSLFGEGAFSGEKPSIKKATPPPNSAERILVKETQLHLAQKELNKLKYQLKNAETTKSQVLVELEKAKRTVEDLTEKLTTVNQAKELSIKQTESAKILAKQLEESKTGDPSVTGGAWNQELEETREQYKTIIYELDASKQELRKIQQDHEEAMDVKDAAIKQVEEAEDAAKTNKERVVELSKEISAVQEVISQVKLETFEAKQEQAKIFADKDVQKHDYKTILKESAEKMVALREEFDPEVTRNLEAQLAEAEEQIGCLNQQMVNTKASDLDLVKAVTSELDDAKGSLKKVAEEEGSLRGLVETLKRELENVRKEHAEIKVKEAETESMIGNLHVKLRKSKSELEACLVEDSRTREASDEMIATLHQLVSETEAARKEAEEMKNKAEELRKEAEATKANLKEAEKKLRVALEEAEEAKEAETMALNEIKNLSEKTSAARCSTSESGAKITLSKEEFESLSRKVEESDTLAEMKVGAAIAQVEAVKASEDEALKRLAATEKEMEEMRAETEAALKRADMAEAARRAVEGELRRWRDREQKKAAETASRILVEAEKSVLSSPPPQVLYRVEKQIQESPDERVVEVKKRLDKDKISVSKKVLRPNISGIFNRKKNQVEGGSPSYLPGEKKP